MKRTDELLKDLAHDHPLAENPNGQLLTKMKREYDLKKKKMLVSCFLYLVIGLVVMLQGGLTMKNADEVRSMIFGAVLVIIGFEITVLIKLGYGSMFALVRTLEAVKEVQLDLAETGERSQSVPT